MSEAKKRVRPAKFDALVEKLKGAGGASSVGRFERQLIFRGLYRIREHMVSHKALQAWGFFAVLYFGFSSGSYSAVSKSKKERVMKERMQQGGEA